MSDNMKAKKLDFVLPWLSSLKLKRESVKIQEVRENGVIVYDVDSSLAEVS